jgi:serine/threonine protein kinase
MTYSVSFINSTQRDFLELSKSTTTAVWKKGETVKINGQDRQFKNHVVQFERASRKNPGSDLLSFAETKESLLGQGSFGAVYRPLENITPDYTKIVFKNKKKKQVIKVIRNIDNSEKKKIVEEEYEICKRAGHLGIKKPVFHHFHAYVVMKQIPGKTLQSLIYDGTIASLTEDKKLLLSLRIMQALKKQVKDPGIIHRDLKPENIMVSFENGIEVNIIDYGLARFEEKNDGKNPGTPLYASPEHFNSPIIVSHKSDVFAIARTIARLWLKDLQLYNEAVEPFESRTLKARRYAKLAAEQLTIPEQPKLEELLKKMLSVDHDERYDIDQSLDFFQNNFPEIFSCTKENEINCNFSSQFIFQLFGIGCGLSGIALVAAGIALTVTLATIWPIGLIVAGGACLAAAGFFAYKASENPNRDTALLEPGYMV